MIRGMNQPTHTGCSMTRMTAQPLWLCCIGLAAITLQVSADPAAEDAGQLQQAAQAEAAPAPYGGRRQRLLDRVKAPWADQIQSSRHIGDKTPVDLAGADGTPTVHGGYAATSPRNPLIGSDCRAESLLDAVENWGRAHHVGLDEAFANRDAHLKDLQQRFGTAPTFADWIEHVAQCKEFCLFAVKDLLECHVQAVSTLPHVLAFFSIDSDRIEPSSVPAIDDFIARQAASPQDRFLLVGRASRVGRAGPGYNRDLSQRRARSVSDRLVERGISPDAIRILSIGYEEPQITKEVAAIYGLQDQLQRLGEDQLNQSVVVVGYRAE